MQSPASLPLPVKNNITGWILAGGRGSRMGGVDKGLQLFREQTLVKRALERLQPQVAQVIINANRHHTEYALTGVKVVADTELNGKGPLSGFLTGLHHCDTEWLVTVPCDSPFFPLDLVPRLAAAVAQQQSLIAMAQTPRSNKDTSEMQPVFSLMHRSLCESLRSYLHNDGEKISLWARQQTALALCVFAPTEDGMNPFANANTLKELQDLQS